MATMERRQCSRAMKLKNSIVLRHIWFFILLILIVLVLASMVFLLLITKARTTEDVVKINKSLNQEIVSGIESKSKLLAPLTSSATKLAKIVSASVNKTKLSFPTIESKVAPLLFQAVTTIPYLSQVSYIGMNGLLFSYCSTEKQQLHAIYSNSSIYINQNKSAKYTWYSQPVSNNTGKLYGEAVTYPASTISNTSTLRFTSLGTSWSDPRDLLFLNTAVMDGTEAISLGFRVKSLTKFFSGFNGNGGSLYFTTKDGQVVREGMLPNTRIVINSSSISIQLLNSHGAQIGQVGSITCKLNDGALRESIIDIWDTKYMLYCSPLEIVGVELVYVLAIPLKRSQSFVHNFNNVVVVVLVMVAAVFVSIIYFVILILQGERTEMNLRAALIQQMEATQRAEKKSLNKSNAFANASHDVRASLAGITGLIELCHELVDPKSELEANLVQMKSCTKDLLGILNAILDTSKIESGKMQIEEEEFEVAQLLEDVADLFHSVGMKKDVDVVLDLLDGSVVKFSHVKGDRAKLRQILCNLVSNAVKFTSEGHVSIRAYTRKPTFDSSTLAKTQSNPLTWLSCLFSKKDEAYNDYKATNAIQREKNCMEFIFEVDDTGKGIPKEKAKSVFENYVQVKETAGGQEGTGLGLNIVQSLVHLMGGEIVIKDKELGRKGTCFNFNTYLITCETNNIIGNAREYDIESHGPYISGESKHLKLPVTLKHRPMVGALVILFIQSEERCRVCRKYMERLGIKVLVVKNYEQFSSTLKHIKQKLPLSTYNFSERSDLIPRRDCRKLPAPQNTRMKEAPLSAIDGTDLLRPTQRTDTKSASNFITIVIDTDGGSFRELSKAVAEFKKDLCNICIRVVWIDKPGARNIQFQGLAKDKLPPTDLIISKPFHGSRLYQVIGNFPELCATEPKFPPPMENEITHLSARKFHSESKTTTAKTRPTSKGNYSSGNLPNLEEEIKESDGPRNVKPLERKKVLVAEDDLVLQKIASSVISKLGASVDICGNGEQALEIVRKSLNGQRKQGNAYFSPYDYIFMDCQMPIMNGFEATRRIRVEEGRYGVHIPIIALSAETSDTEIRMMIQAGMDHHLPKPLNPTKLLQVIMDIHGR